MNKMKEVRQFAERHRLRTVDVHHLVVLVDRFVDQQTHAHNGDPCFPVDGHWSKEKNTEQWMQRADVSAKRIRELAQRLGFASVNFDDGLYPVFHLPDGQTVMLP